MCSWLGLIDPPNELSLRPTRRSVQLEWLMPYYRGGGLGLVIRSEGIYERFPRGMYHLSISSSHLYGITNSDFLFCSAEHTLGYSLER